MTTQATKQRLINAHREDTEQFCVLWIEAYTDADTIQALVTRGPEGGVRTYAKGKLESRAVPDGGEESIPRFSNPLWALDYMRSNRGAKALVTVDAARCLRDGDKYARMS